MENKTLEQPATPERVGVGSKEVLDEIERELCAESEKTWDTEAGKRSGLAIAIGIVREKQERLSSNGAGELPTPAEKERTEK